MFNSAEKRAIREQAENLMKKSNLKWLEALRMVLIGAGLAYQSWNTGDVESYLHLDKDLLIESV